MVTTALLYKRMQKFWEMFPSTVLFLQKIEAERVLFETEIFALKRLYIIHNKNNN